jgi:hypothetical protein
LITAVGHEPGFPGARRGQYQERAIEMTEDGCLLLVWIAHGIGVMRVSERIESRRKDELNGLGAKLKHCIGGHFD